MKLSLLSRLLVFVLSGWQFCAAFQYDFICYNPYCPHIGSSYCICKGDKSKNHGSPCPDYSLGGSTFYLSTIVGLSSDTCDDDLCVMIDTSPHNTNVPNPSGLPTSISCSDDKVYFENDFNNTLYESIDLTTQGEIVDCPTIDDFPATPPSAFLGLVNEGGTVASFAHRSNHLLSLGSVVVVVLGIVAVQCW